MTLVNHRTVYGGGGIMPDVFVSADTSYNSDYFRRLAAKNVLTLSHLNIMTGTGTVLSSKYKSFEDFRNNFEFEEEDIKAFIEKGESEGIKYNEDQFNISKEEILLVLKGLVATNMWETNEYYQIINKNDKVIETALNVISDKNRYDSILGINTGSK
jgi:carboxyl-terminal processing protease